jgi:F-type H+-transporting ATPase subunit epsilon
MALTVEIVTPKAVVWKGEADDVAAPGELGEFDVLPQHIAFLTTLRPGVVTVRSKGSVKRYQVGQGFAEAGASHVVILAESCEEMG